VYAFGALVVKSHLLRRRSSQDPFPRPYQARLAFPFRSGLFGRRGEWSGAAASRQPGDCGWFSRLLHKLGAAAHHVLRRWGPVSERDASLIASGRPVGLRSESDVHPVEPGRGWLSGAGWISGRYDYVSPRWLWITSASTSTCRSTGVFRWSVENGCWWRRF